MQEFNIINRLEHDARIREFGQDCQGDKPIIRYNECSQDFTDLYWSAASAFDRYARKHAGVVVPRRSILVWPGLSFRHSMGRSVPAWALSRRRLNSTFAKWIFSASAQCQMGDVDNTVCASRSLENDKDVIAVVPWLGGDYNPWSVQFSSYVCFFWL